MAADFDNFNYKNHKLDCILTFISGLEVPEYAIHSLKAIVLYDFFENQQNNDKYTKYLDAEIIDKNLSLFDIAIYLGHTTGILFPEQLSRYINRFLVQLERINIPNFNDQCSRHNHLADDYFESYTETVPLCDVLKMHGYAEHAELFTHEFLKKNTLKYLAYDIFSLRDRLEIPVDNDFPKQYFPNVPTFNEVFFNYIDKATYSYTRYKYTKYISDWLYRRVKLQQWRQFYNIDIFVLFTSWQLDNKLINDIFDHALSLYLQFVEVYFKAFYQNYFDLIQDQEIKSKLALKIKEIIINLSIGDISDIDTEFAKSNLRIEDINLISKQLQNANNISIHHTLSKINIHNRNSVLIADALIKYKDYLDQFLNPVSHINNSNHSDNTVPASKLDLTFILAEDFLENLSEKNLSHYDSSTLSFEKGYIYFDNNFFKCKFFNCQLYTILFCPEPLDATIPITNRPVTFKGSDYFKTYIDAYKEGEEFFVITYNFDLYKPEALVETIKLLYFPKDRTNIYNRNYWSYVKVMNPFIISHAIIRDYGYNSGIINKVHELIDLHPILFKGFYDSDNSSSSNASLDDQIRIISSSLNISFSKFQEFKDIIKSLDTNNDSAIKLYASLTLQFDHLKREILDNKLILSVDKFNIYWLWSK